MISDVNLVQVDGVEYVSPHVVVILHMLFKTLLDNNETQCNSVNNYFIRYPVKLMAW